MAESLDEETCKLVFEALIEHSDDRIRTAATNAVPDAVFADSFRVRDGLERCALRRTPTMEAIKAMSMEATQNRELSEDTRATAQWPSLLTARRNAGRKTTMEEIKLINSEDGGARCFPEHLEDLGDALVLASVQAQQQVCRAIQTVIAGGPASIATETPTTQIAEV